MEVFPPPHAQTCLMLIEVSCKIVLEIPALSPWLCRAVCSLSRMGRELLFRSWHATGGMEDG